MATLGLHWVHYSVCTVYTASVRTVYTLNTLGFDLGRQGCKFSDNYQILDF